jgi:hypothetical protein
MPGRLYVLDGATGAEHYAVRDLNSCTTPALGDIDGDGEMEIVTIDRYMHVVALNADGSELWTGPTVDTPYGLHFAHPAIALADLDNDGAVEILAGRQILDAQGNELQALDDPLFTGHGQIPVAADLDGDGDLEVVFGRTAWHHDGSNYYTADVRRGYPQVADLDDDPEPEILVASEIEYGPVAEGALHSGLNVLEHDGQVKIPFTRPYAGGGAYYRPIALAALDDSSGVRAIVTASDLLGVLTPALVPLWQQPVADPSGNAGGTAFDFLGDGGAEVVYADETDLWVFDELGNVLMSTPRLSGTLEEYPVVADVDNDGSAELLVVSNRHGWYPDEASPTLQVIGDAQERWVPTRRIFNQHTYHVTNVSEDGRIPQFETPHWQVFNSFRVNIQIEDGMDCLPPAG